MLRSFAEPQVVHKWSQNAAMSGLKKAKKYDWKDSNLALFGSDLEKKLRGSNEFSWKLDVVVP